MDEIIEISTSDVVPDEQSVMQLQGIPASREPPENARQLFRAALVIYQDCAHPAGILKQILEREFMEIYKGESLNEQNTPVPGIAARARALALFAVTLGHAVHDRISGLFGGKELALGSMLDSCASIGAEKAADLVEVCFVNSLIGKGLVNEECVAMRYSPGYCGWHVSGQKKLFDYLKPERIGMKLRESYLMEPLKSVSGVIIAGKREIHIIEDNYPFCSECETHSCQERMKML